MRFPQKILRSPIFLISLLLVAFFLKGVFLATLFPMFTGQDEARHYNSAQFINEPTDKIWEKSPKKAEVNRDTFADYNFSEEILFAGTAAGIDDIRSGLYNTTDFSNTSLGKNEGEILEQKWRPYNLFEYPDAVRGSLYHTITGKIEGALADQNILVRFYSIRIFSVLLGTFAVLLAFLIARTIGFSPYISTLFAALVAFQPKFSMYLTNINYDAFLIPLFFLFTWGGVLSLRDGINWKNVSIMITAIALGILTKGTAVILFVAFLGLIGFHLFRKAKNPKKLFIAAMIFVGIFLIANAFLETKYSLRGLFPLKGSATETLLSLGEYLDTSLTPGRFALSSRTYWGALGWNDSVIINHLTNILWPIQAIATLGIILFLFTRNKPDFLPDKTQIAFLISMIVALQLGIRLADWNVFASTGSLDLGTPGRYFLPNLATHLILVFVGFGMLLGKREYFKNILKGGVILMFFFSLYLTFNVILPRFYL